MALVLLGLVAGVLVGCVGIGGVIVVPVLVYVFGAPIQGAIATAMSAFLVSGLVGTAVFAGRGAIRWDMAAWLWAGAMPAAFAGALAVTAVPSRVVESAVGLLVALAGLHALLDRGSGAPRRGALSNPMLLAAGAGTGFVSALTGTGGPLVLVPALTWLKLPVLVAIGLAQAIQLPIAVLATGGNWLAGTLDPASGAAVGAGMAVGTWAGARLAHALPRARLRTLVAALLVAVGGLMLATLLVSTA